ncbi:thiolase family protein [Streptomyces sp. NPDC090075]|uniref:thiolase family protein n=1 Tax=Streptomyces sp. NPDC090075 TaxID=3365937 RepID=UPI00381C3807
MNEVVIAAAMRTAHGKRNGTLAGIHPVDLMADVLTALVERTGIDPAGVDDVVVGCATQFGDQSSNVGRYSVLAAGWPETVPGATVNRACGSSQQALDHAAHAVMAGQAEMVVAAGVESMSRVPMNAAKEAGFPYGHRARARYGGREFSQGVSAELIAERWHLSRRELDQFSAVSHARAAAAVDAGAFDEQIVPIDVAGTAFAVDEGIRRGSSVESLAKLKPVFAEDGVLHAGNSSQISDGAAALLVTTPQRAKAAGLTPFARYHTGAVVGSDPVLMLTGPIPATEQVLKKSGVPLSQIGVFEVNEAFAPVPLAWLKETGADPELLNPLGGAIALGHPLGASGVSLMTRMVHHMRARGIRYGLQAMCEGGGTANATLVELLA